jgi:hypothetical protein
MGYSLGLILGVLLAKLLSVAGILGLINSLRDPPAATVSV